MDDAAHMTVSDAVEDLAHELGGCVLAEAFFLGELTEELAAVAELGHDVVELLLTVDLEHLDDVGVLLSKCAPTSCFSAVYSFIISLSSVIRERSIFLAARTIPVILCVARNTSP